MPILTINANDWRKGSISILKITSPSGRTIRFFYEAFSYKTITTVMSVLILRVAQRKTFDASIEEMHIIKQACELCILDRMPSPEYVLVRKTVDTDCVNCEVISLPMSFKQALNAVSQTDSLFVDPYIGQQIGYKYNKEIKVKYDIPKTKKRKRKR